MVRDPLRGEDTPDLQTVLDALDDTDCRTIIRHLDEPMTASEVSEECDIPMSTTYRKLDLLSEASLLAEGTQVRPDGHHATQYRVAFEEVAVGLDESRELTVSISRPARTADERLASLWGEVRKET
ncbi:MAG: helix-turn-helix domain-containing protein [Haloferacaceae archaeon]